MLDQVQFNQQLVHFLTQATTPFHAVKVMAVQLEQAGFQRLFEGQSWSLNRGSGYYVTRNDSSIIAFRGDIQQSIEQGWRMIGAHTDSPCLKLRPNPVVTIKNYQKLAVEIYGGVLLAPWFDRDLSLAGRVTFCAQGNSLQHRLIDFKRAIGCVPNLAIHLNRGVNESRSINPEQEIYPIVYQSLSENEEFSFEHFLLEQLKKEHPDVVSPKILAFDLCFYDSQAPQIIGLESQFLASGRLDNLLSCFIGLQTMLSSRQQTAVLLVCNDHEEVGSQSASGAQGPFLKQVLERILPDQQQRMRSMAHSLLISTDNAHGLHPNYPDKHDSNHQPMLNGGPVIKINANQRYASNSVGVGFFRYLSEREQLPYQMFVSRSDMQCGSTIGPLTASQIGVNTLDVGVPTFAMHSPRELAGVKDSYYLYQILKSFVSWSDAIVSA